MDHRLHRVFVEGAIELTVDPMVEDEFARNNTDGINNYFPVIVSIDIA